MSVVLTRPPAALFREEQNFHWWLYVALGVMAVATMALLRFDEPIRPPAAPIPFRWRSLELPVYLLVGIGLPSLIALGILHMTTEVGPDACIVTFGWLPTYRRAIVLSEVARVEIVTYRAIREHGFWGIRATRDGERVLTARGDKAVRLHMLDGSRVLIGTQRAEELAGVIEHERRC